MAARRNRNEVIRTEGGSTRPEALENATGEEPFVDESTTAYDDGRVPKPVGSSRPAGSLRPDGDSVENHEYG